MNSEHTENYVVISVGKIMLIPTKEMYVITSLIIYVLPYITMTERKQSHCINWPALYLTILIKSSKSDMPAYHMISQAQGLTEGPT